MVSCLCIANPLQTEAYVNGRKRKDLLTVDKYGILNEVLVRLFRDIMDI